MYILYGEIMEDSASKILKEKFGYDVFKPNQLEIIKLIVSGNNCISILPTGFGKSILFIISALLLKGVSIIISPLIALMNDQKKNLAEKGIEVIIFHSDLSEKEEKNAFDKLLKNQVKIIYVSPERLCNNKFRKIINNIEISLIAVDEAHTILWGDSFRDSFLKISDFITFLGYQPTILAVTATATAATINRITEVLMIKEYKLIYTSVVRKNIIYNVQFNKNKDDFISKYINKYKNEKIIIYCLTRKTVERLGAKFNILIYHGGLEKKMKNDNQKLFSEGIKNVIACTNAWGMGINISDIRHVIHYEIPSSIEDLVQQAGRAARDGKEAYETILFDFDDIKIVKSFIENTNDLIKKRELGKLNKVVDFCLSRKCRHQLIASYFDEKIEKCNHFCDNCLKR